MVSSGTKVNLKSFAIFIFLLANVSCSHTPNRHQQNIMDYLADIADENEYWYQECHFDIKKNDAVFVYTINTSNCSPAFVNTLVEQYKDKERCRRSARTISFFIEPIMGDLIKANADVRYIVKTDNGIVLSDYTFPPSEYSSPISDEEYTEIIIDNTRQQALSLKTRLPIIIEEGVIMTDVRFVEGKQIFRLFITVSDNILTQYSVRDLEKYAQTLTNEIANEVFDIFPELGDCYERIGLSMEIILIDVRGNCVTRGKRCFSSPLDTYRVPTGWMLYEGNIFSIAYPPVLEVKCDYAELEKVITKHGKEPPPKTDITFQPKGMNANQLKAFTNYLRVICHPVVAEKGSFLKANDKYMKREDVGATKYMLFELIRFNSTNVDGSSLLIEPKNPNEVQYHWVHGDFGTLRLSTSYKRYGVKDLKVNKNEIIKGEICLFQNDSEGVYIVLAAPQCKWTSYDSLYFTPMLNSFMWNHANY